MIIKAAGRENIPNIFGHKWHNRMEETHARIEDKHQITLHLQTFFRRAIKQATLAELHIPVADFAPEERLKFTNILAKLIGFKTLG